MLEIIKKDYIINAFDDITSIYKYISNTPRRPNAKNSSEDKDYCFTGTYTLEEAIDYMRYGCDELYKKVIKEKRKIDIEKLMGSAIVKKQGKNDIIGFQANVPAYLTNNPLSMINTIPNKTSQKVLNILLSADVTCGISTNEIEQAGTIYLNCIDILEKLGYRCNLFLGYCVENDCGNQVDRMYMMTKIKTDREPLNIKKMCFPIAHPAMFRRIGFAWIERCHCYSAIIPSSSEDITHNGYGRPYSNNKQIKEDLKLFADTNFIIWHYESNCSVSIEGVLERLKKSGINLDIEF